MFRHRWVSGAQNSSDGLTKTSPSALNALLRAIKLGSWRIVYDESFTSAKKKIAAKNKLKKVKKESEKQLAAKKKTIKSFLIMDHNRNLSLFNENLNYSDLLGSNHYSH